MWIKWWPSARGEAKAMGRIIPWLFYDAGAPLGPVLFACDAMGSNAKDQGGWGVVAASTSLSTIESLFVLGVIRGSTVVTLDNLPEHRRHTVRKSDA